MYICMFLFYLCLVKTYSLYTVSFSSESNWIMKKNSYEIDFKKSSQESFPVGVVTWIFQMVFI